MCEFIVSNMVSQSNSLEDLVKMKVLEPAIGSGAFLAQFVRTLYREARQKWEITDSCKFKKKALESMIHGCDIDEEAIVLAEAVLWISSECPEQGLDLNLRIINSLGAGACQDITTWAGYTGFEINEGYSAILGNPPYVRVSANSLDGFDTKSARTCMLHLQVFYQFAGS